MTTPCPGGEQPQRGVQGGQVGGHVGVAVTDERRPAWPAGPPGPRSPCPPAGSAAGRTGTGSAAQLRTTWLVASVLALSTTRMAVRTGSVAALRHSAASPSGEPARLVARRYDDLE